MEDYKFKKIVDVHNYTMLSLRMTLKYIKVIQKEIKINDEELQEMINFFSKNEQYILCDKLIKLKNNIC